MKLEERRQWVRAGCPVEDEGIPQRPPFAFIRCQGGTGYLLQAWPDRRRVTAFCARCGTEAAVGVRPSGGEERDWNLLRIAVGTLCDWMDQHAGRPEDTAYRSLFRPRADSGRMAAWVDRLMGGSQADGTAIIDGIDGEHVYTLNRFPSYGDHEPHKVVALPEKPADAA